MCEHLLYLPVTWVMCVSVMCICCMCFVCACLIDLCVVCVCHMYAVCEPVCGVCCIVLCACYVCVVSVCGLGAHIVSDWLYPWHLLGSRGRQRPLSASHSGPSHCSPSVVGCALGLIRLPSFLALPSHLSKCCHGLASRAGVHMAE